MEGSGRAGHYFCHENFLGCDCVDGLQFGEESVQLMANTVLLFPGSLVAKVQAALACLPAPRPARMPPGVAVAAVVRVGLGEHVSLFVVVGEELARALGAHAL